MKAKTDHANYGRDLNSSAILAHDKKALMMHRKKLNGTQEINNLKTEVKELKEKLDLILFHLQDTRGINA